MNASIRKHFPKVTQVVDSRASLLVEVTPQDVHASKRKNHTECAMAVACRRMLHADGMIIGKQTVYLIKGRKAVRFGIPESVRKEIVAFDRGAPFEPGEYQLSKPPKPYGVPGGKNKDKTHNGPKRHVHVTTNVRSGITAWE